jgi:ornithine--oxo-acid transaminase
MRVLTPAAEHLALAETHLAHNYHPLPVVLAEGEGCWVTDVAGRRYLDLLAGYSALNFGHRHPALVAAAKDQLDRLTLVSRAFHHDQLGPFARDLAALCAMDLVLPMNTGTEAVEAALKVARTWGYDVKGVPPGTAKIVAVSGNFHGRSISIVGFSTDPLARNGFGPFPPGFDVVPFGDVAALEAAIDDATVAVLLEPIQGEAGVIVPPVGYLAGVREVCTRRGVLLLADEVQSGLGRTGTTFACDLEAVRPDVYILGKALGGGILPVSAVVADSGVLGVLHPGEHGSTFGGNPVAAAVGRAVVAMLATGEHQAHAREMGALLLEGLQSYVGRGIAAIRGVGLWAGVDVDPSLATGREMCEALLAEGVLAKDTHGSTIRLAPPLVVTPEEVELALTAIGRALVALGA